MKVTVSVTLLGLGSFFLVPSAYSNGDKDKGKTE
jgi:hypothetical protein